MAYTIIDRSSNYFRTKLYTGTGSATSITFDESTNMQPDFVWIKSRSNAYNNMLFDVLRGAGTSLFSNSTTGDEVNSPTSTTSFDSNGFSLGTNIQVNNSGSTFVNWSWKANGAGVSNTSGTISSTVSANTTSGFSIISYTGNGSSSATVGHGLGVVPKMVICKERNNSDLWQVRHEGLSSNYNLWLHATDRAYNMTNEVNNGGIANLNSSSTFGFVQGVQDVNSVNQSSSTYIAYCFAEVKGFSKFSSFVGNGSTDGAFVYTGFKPAFVMIKASSVGGTGYNWGVWDNKRLGYNADNNDLRINLTNAEATDDSIDLLSNGFKIRTDSGGFGGGSGTTYIYMCFAESPFVSSKSIPTTAR